MSSNFVDHLAQADLPLLSVIVPVFNTERYLQACLNSLVPHDPSTIEIIIVHDGGTDRSLEIAKEWVRDRAANLRTYIIDQPNAGLSAARTEGLRQARGEFVAFLDSDDIANVETLVSAALDARTHTCDIVLFRSAVLDGVNLEAQPFYDSWVWDEILSGQSFRRTRLTECPRLLRLEPNANTRVIRRTLFNDKEIEFPHGLYFEDMLPHVQQFLCDRSIGLKNEIGYLYRVNRIGKITDQKGRSRFDSIQVATMAFAAAKAGGISLDAWANLILQTARLLSWCAEYTTNADRLQFCTSAIAAMDEAPKMCFDLALNRWCSDPRERAVITLFRDKDAQGLKNLASGRFDKPHLLKRFTDNSILWLRSRYDHFFSFAISK